MAFLLDSVRDRSCTASDRFVYVVRGMPGNSRDRRLDSGVMRVCKTAGDECEPPELRKQKLRKWEPILPANRTRRLSRARSISAAAFEGRACLVEKG